MKLLQAFEMPGGSYEVDALPVVAVEVAALPLDSVHRVVAIGLTGQRSDFSDMAVQLADGSIVDHWGTIQPSMQDWLAAVQKAALRERSKRIYVKPRAR